MPKIIIVQYEEDPGAITQFKMDIQYLWSDHVSYTRDAISSILSGLDDINAIADRLAKNQEDIGAMIVPYFGKDAGDKLTTLLKEHIVIATDIIRYTKSGISTADALSKWNTNAAAIADMLSSLDPDCWPKDTVLKLLKDHLACTSLEITTYMNKDWVANIAAYDQGHLAIIKLSDALADGVVCKFPEKFVKYDQFPTF